MPCDLLRLNVLLRDEQEKTRSNGSETYDIYAYCEGEAHQAGPFECHLNRDEILFRFKELLPIISRSSLWRGATQAVIVEEDFLQRDAIEEVDRGFWSRDNRLREI